MAEKTKAVPEGFHAVTPHLMINGAARAIEFYKKAFGATELFRMSGPGGKLMHAEIKIGDSVLMLADEIPGMGGPSPSTLKGTPVVLNLYAEDVDSVMSRAVQAGAKVTMPAADMFWGDRYGQVEDPFGHRWAIATHKEDLSPEEIKKRGEEFFTQMAKR